MFMFKASAYLRELEKLEPEILSICKKSFITENRDLDFIRIENSVFRQCLNKSIDYAVMEHTKNSVVVPLDANWSDVGAWLSLWDVKAKDKNNNVSEGDIVLEDVKNTYTYSSNRLVSVAGVSDLVIIDTQDAVLVTDKQHTHLIKKIISRLQNHNRSEVEQHRKVFRPWGHYDTVDSGKGFQVKRIMVSPRAKLSLQNTNTALSTGLLSKVLLSLHVVKKYLN